MGWWEDTLAGAEFGAGHQNSDSAVPMSSSGDKTVPLGRMREKRPTGTRAAPQTSGRGNGEERVLLAGWCRQEQAGAAGLGDR